MTERFDMVDWFVQDSLVASVVDNIVRSLVKGYSLDNLASSLETLFDFVDMAWLSTDVVDVRVEVGHQLVPPKLVVTCEDAEFGEWFEYVFHIPDSLDGDSIKEYLWGSCDG